MSLTVSVVYELQKNSQMRRDTYNSAVRRWVSRCFTLIIYNVFLLIWIIHQLHQLSQVFFLSILHFTVHVHKMSCNFIDVAIYLFIQIVFVQKTSSFNKFPFSFQVGLTFAFTCISAVSNCLITFKSTLPLVAHSCNMCNVTFSDVDYFYIVFEILPGHILGKW